jgi:AcrR family transcriptional regulator
VSRTRPVERFAQLISAAAGIFVDQGYHRTQMQDVADALGVAKGTVYGFVAGKAALFGAALRYADGIEPPPPPDRLPLPTPADGELATLVTGRIHREAGELRLIAALSAPTTDNVGGELIAIVTDLYHTLVRNRVSIKLIDRCAAELPDLAAIWFGTGRDAQVTALTEYLTRHTKTGALRLPGPASLVARTILETCVLWAVHLHWNHPDDHRDSEHPDTDTIASTLAGLLTHGLLPPAHRSERQP